MTISKVHFEFANRVKTVVALNNPQKNLGRHYKKVLEFWEKIENLTQEQWRVVEERYDALYRENHSEWDESTELAIDTSIEVVGWGYAYDAGWAAHYVTKFGAAGWATREIIGGVANPTLLPMFDNL
jgi:hypothetical protein